MGALGERWRQPGPPWSLAVGQGVRLDGGRIVLGDGGRKGGEFAFTPDESEAKLNARLATRAKR